MGDYGQIDQVSTLFSHQNHVFTRAAGIFVRERDSVTSWHADVIYIKQG